jgi:hypothetical protein
MGRLVALTCVIVGALFVSIGSASPAPRTGFLAGVTEISVGCPGPTRTGGSCNPWHALPHARFQVVRLSALGRPVAGTRRVLASDWRAAFRITLVSGSYAVTGLPGPDSDSGPAVKVVIRPGQLTKVVVRFLARRQLA